MKKRRKKLSPTQNYFPRCVKLLHLLPPPDLCVCQFERKKSAKYRKYSASSYLFCLKGNGKELLDNKTKFTWKTFSSVQTATEKKLTIVRQFFRAPLLPLLVKRLKTGGQGVWQPKIFGHKIIFTALFVILLNFRPPGNSAPHGMRVVFVAWLFQFDFNHSTLKVKFVESRCSP